MQIEGENAPAIRTSIRTNVPSTGKRGPPSESRSMPARVMLSFKAASAVADEMATGLFVFECQKKIPEDTNRKEGSGS